MRLKSGLQAPEIEYQDYKGSPFKLSSLRGKRVMLSFYRYAGCPFCQLRFMELVERYGYDKDVQFVAVFQSSAEFIYKHAAGGHHSVIVIADPAERFYKLYGVEHGMRVWALGLGSIIRFFKSLKRGHKFSKIEGHVDRIPADFLIDKDGILRHVYYGNNMDDHMPIEWIDKFISL